MGYLRKPYLTQSTCERDNPTCQKEGPFWRTPCKDGYTAGPLGSCYSTCPEGFKPSPKGCIKPITPRPSTVPATCPEGQTLVNGKCYPAPPQGYACTDNTCVAPCPADDFVDENGKCVPVAKPKVPPIALETPVTPIIAVLPPTVGAAPVAPANAPKNSPTLPVAVPMSYMEKSGPAYIRESDKKEGVFIPKGDLANFGMDGFTPDQLEGCTFFVPLDYIDRLPTVWKKSDRSPHLLFPPLAQMRNSGISTKNQPATPTQPIKPMSP